MHPDSNFFVQRWQAAHAARTANAGALAVMLQQSRARTLALVEAYQASLGDSLVVPYSPQLNPPLWELGHIGWFQEFWLARNPQRALGVLADPEVPRRDSLLAQADSLYNSSLVPHTSRWHLPLPNLQVTQAFLKDSLAATLALLASEPEDDAALYFYRLALFHEDMHGEAAVYMAQALGIELPPHLRGARGQDTRPRLDALSLPAIVWTLGYARDSQPVSQAPGFAFDNELSPYEVSLNSYSIDSKPVSWARYLPFVEAGGYEDPSHWSLEGWPWRCAQTQACPRYLRRSAAGASNSGWERQLFGQWQTLDVTAPACHLSFFEAQAWCSWAGRQLPTEAQWECAAMTAPDFHWGSVWEWTASTFNPYPGFVPHPYRDYSAPWFGDRPVLRGASSATSERMAHPRYRNYFTPERNDLHAGFRSSAG
jgi:gamma-glutamyl hercynylcysteine S-oxide synthase